MPAVPGSIHLPNADPYCPLNLAEVVEHCDVRLRNGNLENYRPAPLGFPQIDACLGGGLRAEDLMQVGGIQNVGKTIVALQVARNLRRAGRSSSSSSATNMARKPSLITCSASSRCLTLNHPITQSTWRHPRRNRVGSAGLLRHCPRSRRAPQT